jgi:hypothetical protein
MIAVDALGCIRYTPPIDNSNRELLHHDNLFRKGR